MAEQKNHNNELNVEDALTQSEAFLVKNKKAIIGAVVAVIVIVAGAISTRISTQNLVKKKHRLLFSKANSTLSKVHTNKH